jgi:purine-binding chemotaxis protein CheW
MAQRPDTLYEAEDTQRGRYLVFALDGEHFGIEIRHITEITGMQPITPLPEAQSHIKGIINLRGTIIPVVDIRLKFKKTPIAYTDRTCIIIADTRGFYTGLIVDNVAEVVSIAEGDIAAPPSIGAGAHNRYIHGIGKLSERVVLLLDCEKLFSDDEANALNEIVEGEKR